jgi:ankyrin repeat protein
MTMEDDVGATPLHRAAARGELRAIDFLVDALANGTTEAPKTALEARDKRGQTPLLVACEAGQDEAAIRLAKHGANVGAKDGEKRGVEELAPKLVSALAQIEAER